MLYAAILVVSAAQQEPFLSVMREVQSTVLARGVPPHLTLAVFNDDVDENALAEATAAFARTHHAPEIEITALAMFSTECPAVYAAPVVTPALLDYHREYHLTLRELAGPSFSSPGDWTPHVTLDIVDSLDAAQHVMALAYRANLRGTYLFDELVLGEFYPYRIIGRYPLSPVTGKIE